MSISRTTAAGLLAAHIDNATAVTPRPLPYRERRRRAAYLRWVLAAAAAVAWGAAYL